LLIWTPADGRRGSAPTETDPITDAFTESASANGRPPARYGPICDDVFLVRQKEPQKGPTKDLVKAGDDAWCTADRPTRTRVLEDADT
jgi:hypothetical protein